MIFELQSANDNFKSIVTSWASAKRKVSDNIGLKVDNKGDCRIAMVQENDSIFTVEIELEKIASLKAKLSLIASQLPLKVQWLQTVNYVMRYDLDRLIAQNAVATRKVSEGTYRLLWDAGHSYGLFLAVVHDVKKTLNIVDNMDFSPAVFHSDLCGPKFIPKLLRLASEVIEEATEYAKHGMADVKFSEE
ncbi:MAG: hypothetical protein ABSF44_09600 [Candidatus Bathyarchaeia archaeon]|jgi:hypothetical protein